MADRFIYGGDPAYTLVPITFAAADNDSIMTSVATATSIQVYSAANLDGIIGDDAMSSRRVTVYTKSQTGAYVASAITITGTTEDSPSGTTDTLQLTQTAGGETITSTKFFTSVTQISVPANGSTSGSLKFGTELAPSANISGCRGLYVGEGGDVHLIAEDGSSGTFVGVPDGFVLPVRARRVLTSVDGTTASSMIALK